MVDCAEAPKCAKAKELWHEATRHGLAQAVVDLMEEAAINHVLTGTDPGQVKDAHDSERPVVYKQSIQCDAVTAGLYIGKADKSGRTRQRNQDNTVARGDVTQRVHSARIAFAGRPYHAVVLVEFPAADDDDWWQALYSRLCPRTSAVHGHPTADIINTFLSQTEAAFVALLGTFQAGAAYVKSWEAYFKRPMPAIMPLNGTPATEGNYGRSTAATYAADAPTRRVLASQIRNSLAGQPGGLPDCDLVSAVSASQISWRLWLPGLEAQERLRLGARHNAALAVNGEYEVSLRAEVETGWTFCRRLTAAEREAVRDAKVWFRVRDKKAGTEVVPWTPWEVFSADAPSLGLQSRIRTAADSSTPSSGSDSSSSSNAQRSAGAVASGSGSSSAGPSSTRWERWLEGFKNGDVWIRGSGITGKHDYNFVWIEFPTGRRELHLPGSMWVGKKCDVCLKVTASSVEAAVRAAADNQPPAVASEFRALSVGTPSVQKLMSEMAQYVGAAAPVRKSKKDLMMESVLAGTYVGSKTLILFGDVKLTIDAAALRALGLTTGKRGPPAGLRFIWRLAEDGTASVSREGGTVWTVVGADKPDYQTNAKAALDAWRASRE